MCRSNQGSLAISFKSGTQSDPCISSVTTSIMIVNSNSPVKGRGIPIQFLDVLLHTIACSGLSRVRTELFHLPVIPFLAHHPVQTNRQSPRHGDLGRRRVQRNGYRGCSRTAAALLLDRKIRKGEREAREMAGSGQEPRAQTSACCQGCRRDTAICC